MERIVTTAAAEREKIFIKNGSLLQEKLIDYSNGRYNPFRHFSVKELKRATNNYDPHCLFYTDGLAEWYRGSLDGRVLSVIVFLSRYNVDGVVNEIAIAAQLSGYKYFLKLSGCCLETPVPILVYESVKKGNVKDRIGVSGEFNPQPLPWKSRLKIAREVAHAVAYLHTAFSRPIIHRDLNPSNIFLDENDVAKLTNFLEALYIREGEKLQVGLRKICFYMPPEYALDGEVTEKLDVYSFGSLLLFLLTGFEKGYPDIANRTIYFDHLSVEFIKHYVKCHGIDEVVDHRILAEEGGIDEQQQWQAVLELALRCQETIKERRPTMVEVTKQLWQLERSSTTVSEIQRSILPDGRIFMEALIADYEGRCNALQVFSAEELRKMTDNYHLDYSLSDTDCGIWYKGETGNGNFSILKLSGVNWCESVEIEFKTAVELRAHQNVLKLLGCCLETPIPTLVYESAANGMLYFNIRKHLSLNSRLKIAKQIADDVAQLHTAFSAPIIYKNLNSRTIFLDNRDVPKLSNIGHTVSIHEDEAIHRFGGTEVYIPPEYITEGIMTEEFDTYSFGLLLFELLIGHRVDYYLVKNQGGLSWGVSSDRINEVVDPLIEETEEWLHGHAQQKWKAVSELASRCLETAKEKRPKMIELATELGQILEA